MYVKLDAIGLDKVDRLMGGDIICNEIFYFFEDFVSRCPEWRCENNRDEATSGDKHEHCRNQIIDLSWPQFLSEQNEKIPIIRKQKNSGLCYLHAPIVLKIYLVAFACGR